MKDLNIFKKVMKSDVLKTGVKDKLYIELESNLPSEPVKQVPAVMDVIATLNWLKNKPKQRVRLTPKQKEWPLEEIRQVNALLQDPEPEQEKIAGPHGTHIFRRNAQKNFRVVSLLYNLLVDAGWTTINDTHYTITAQGEELLKKPVVHQYLDILWAHFVLSDWSKGEDEKDFSLKTMKNKMAGILQQTVPQRLSDFLTLSEQNSDGWVQSDDLREKLTQNFSQTDTTEGPIPFTMIIGLAADKILWEKLPWLGLAEIEGNPPINLLSSIDKYRVSPLGRIVLPVLASDQAAFDKPEHTEVEETKIPPRRKVGRNEPCPCGSGRKFKKCCL